MREGYFDAYYTKYSSDLENTIRTCVKSCSSPDECVFLTGDSQGGAIATAAAIALADLNPYVITFGQPSAVVMPCPAINSERFYRYVNTMTDEDVGILYDPVPFLPAPHYE